MTIRTKHSPSAPTKLARDLEQAAPGIRVQHVGSLFWSVMAAPDTADGVARAIAQIPAVQKERYAKTFHALLDAGYYLAPSGFEVSFLSTAHTTGVLEGFVEAVARAARA